MLNFPDKLALNRFNPSIRFILTIAALWLACISAHAGVNSRTVSNSYDCGYRLATESIAETGGSSTVTAYQYDKGNNRTQKSITVDGGAAVVTNSVYGTTTDGFNSNQLKSANDGTTTTEFFYDLNGNRSEKKVNGVTAQTYSWDHENRLTQLTEAGTGTFHYAYDHRTRRVLRDESQAGGQSTVLTFSGGLSVQEYLSGGSTPEVEYIRGCDYGGGIGGILYTIRNGNRSYNAYNSRGDVVSKTDDNGAITWQSSYEAFGTRTQEQGSTEDRQKANTKDEDPTGLLNEHYRYRDLEFGVFITRDPAGFVDGPNVYTYVRQNPWTMFDPDGLQGYLTSGAGMGFVENIAGFFSGIARAFTSEPAQMANEMAHQVGVNTLPVMGKGGVSLRTSDNQYKNATASTEGWAKANIDVPLAGITNENPDSESFKSHQTVGSIVAPLPPIAKVGKLLKTSKAIATESALLTKTITNTVPNRMARVIPEGLNPKTLGAPGANDVFVTAADDIAGMNSQQIAKRLTIPESPTGFGVVEFPTPKTGVASPINRTDSGFIGGGRTAGGAREFVIPNQPIPKGSTKRSAN